MFLGPQFPRWWRHILLNPSSTHSPHQKSMYKSTTDPLKTPPPHISTVTSITIPAPAVTLVRLLVTKNAKPCWGMLLCLDDDTKASTWWLKVLLPTDQEMKLLSKVFGIHPLTTKDILMEETRKKIELFRNYYLVCFCLFDQDPYSPMYLKPLNIYIILFRKGTLLLLLLTHLVHLQHYSYLHFPPFWKESGPLQLLYLALVLLLFWIQHVYSIPAPHL
ncbi:hypothetical protein PTTG_27757 [Puccinia triticina 1-1 BBBD Race 1]|uniref:Uncharacterized protein n=1 Tax=Puccinia triticina (isolate 1-1 / race 1 (BBBD)) TaxID=630390 RepID=A0A180GHN6_PUCT1|nr:hypothetical protein PTTG_27757 [Puccinia triticina 1-1 BBBD Race 1]